VLEIRVPLHVSSRFWGSLAVGFSLARIHPEVGAIERRAVLVALMLMLVNSLLTAVYVETLIRPVLHLHRIMKTASRGDLTVRAEHGRGDEVAELGGAFNAMMDELQRARERDKAQEVQLAQAEKMAAIGTLAAGVAHEVNNPLAGILTCLDMIESSPDDAAARERYLGLVRSGIKRIEHIVRNLLDFSRPREIERRLTSMNERVARVVELVAFQLRSGRVEVRPELAADGVHVLADPFQMEQMLLNLVLNAIQAMPKGGTLTVRTRRLDDRVLVEVIDTGVGIPEAHRSRVFDPFFTTREIGKGTGLGLAVSYNLVKAHGGTIDLDSEPGKGTVARVTLPAAAAPDAREGIA
jgi:signal transduction histidine kinase